MLNADLRSIVRHRAMASSESSSPPRPRLVVQIGVTGHRPNRLSPDVAAALPAQCDRTLKAIAALAFRAYDPLLHSPEPPILRILSPLAEGADRIVANAGPLLALTCNARSHSMKKNTAATFQPNLRAMSFKLFSPKPPPSFKSTARATPSPSHMNESGDSFLNNPTSSSHLGWRACRR